MEIQGEIKAVTHKDTSKGTIYLVTFSDGNEYMTKKQPVATEARSAVGSIVTADVQVSQNGQYTNRYWNGFKLEAGQASTSTQPAFNSQPATPTASVVPQSTSVPSDKDTQIARAVALKAAVDMANGGLLGSPTPGLVVATAKEFVPYLLGVEQPAGKGGTPWDES